MTASFMFLGASSSEARGELYPHSSVSRIDLFTYCSPSSGLNGTLMIRGSKVDYDDWAAKGNVGWGWDDLLPLFKKAGLLTERQPYFTSELIVARPQFSSSLRSSFRLRASMPPSSTMELMGRCILPYTRSLPSLKLSSKAISIKVFHTRLICL